MNKVLGAAAVATALLASSVVSSQAAPYQFPSAGGFTFGNSNVNGSFTNKFAFSVATLSDFTASLTNSTRVISNLVLSLFTSGGTVVATTPIGSQDNAPGNQNRGIGTSLTSGSYYVQVSGTASNRAFSTSYTGNISLSAVPLPGTVALFGTAIMALGVAGAVSRKRKVAASAA